MKKKVLFVLINMNIGGTEKALLNMIHEMEKDIYEITIFMLEEYGGFLEYIPEGVRIQYFNNYKKIKDVLNHPPHLIALDYLKKGNFIKAFNIAFYHLLSKVLRERTRYFNYILNSYPDLEEEFDIAVAYDGPMDFISYFVLNRIKAKKKIQWIHFDITKIGFNTNFAAKTYKKFDKVFVVSKEAKKNLDSVVPSIKNKTEVFYNIISPKLVLSSVKAGKGFDDKYDGFRVLTVGRLSIEKGQDIGIRVLKRLIQDGFKAKWYCIGGGKLKEEYQSLVNKYGLQENFIFLGTDPNPYSYIEQCDIYVQPSRHEGYCIALAEARCLCKPIVTTNFAGAREQINNGETGLIVEVDEDEIYKAIVSLLRSRNLRNKLSKNLKKEKFETNTDLLNHF
ncbi:glycosyltransferase [Neobacillus drentensis]|uniref:glycosyltransferase n=1 Tax=Neobacillus drentensis TaxID=220684 RepID=UPI002FFF1E84